MYDNSVQLIRSMREAEIECRSDTTFDDDNFIDTVRVGWAGRNLPRTTILFRINDRGAHLEVEDLGTMAPGRRGDALEVVNGLNLRYRWVTFTLEEDGRFTCATDVFMVPEVAGLFGIAAMGRMFDTLDEAYPRLHELMA